MAAVGKGGGRDWQRENISELEVKRICGFIFKRKERPWNPRDRDLVLFCHFLVVLP